MKSVQLNGILVCETDIGREVEVYDPTCIVSSGTYKITGLVGDRVCCAFGWDLTYLAGKVRWAEPLQSIMPDPKPYCPRQQAANVLREAYAKCEELGLHMNWDDDGSLLITYQPEEVVY